MSPRLLRPTASGFSPYSISGLALWLDAADGATLFQNSDGTVPATASSDPVGYWGDKSGNGRHAVQSLAGSRPLVGTQNGRKALTFDGTNDVLGLSAPYGSAITLFMVSSPSAGTNDYLIGGNIAGNAPAIISGFAGNPYEWWNNDGADRVSFVASSSGQHVLSMTAVDSGAFTAFYDGANVANKNPAAATTSSAILQFIGSAGAATPLQCANATICEMMLYSRNLSQQERQRAERYLAFKWGITLAPQVANADAQDWVNRVYANGGTVSTSTAQAVDTFCGDIQSAGIRDRFFRLNLFCGTGLNAALVPLYRAASLGDTQLGNATDTNVGGLFVGANYSESGGLVGDGSTKYLKTGLASNQLAGGLTGHAAILRGAGTVATTRIAIGGSDNDVDDFEIHERTNGTHGAWGKTTFMGSAPAHVAGLKMITRSSSTRADLYSNGSSIANSTASVVVAPHANEFYVFGGNRNGSLTLPVAFPVFAYSLGVAMDDTQATDYYNVLSAFQTSMSRA